MLLHIWLLTSQEKIDCEENKRLIKEMKKMKITYTVVIPEMCDVILSDDKKAGIYIDGKKVILPHICLVRHAKHVTDYFSGFLKEYLESKGVLTINSSQTISICVDKLKTLTALELHKVSIPKTLFLKFPFDIDFIERSLRYPILVKKNSGSLGKGIILCNNRNELVDVIETLEALPLPSNIQFIVQEFIELSRGKDIRAFVIGDSIIGAWFRTSDGKDFKANYARGGKLKKYPIDSALRKIVSTAAVACDGDVVGVDILFGKQKNYMISEINSSPYFAAYEDVMHINIARSIIEYALSQYNHQL